MTIASDVGDRITAARKRASLTRRQFADRLGLSTEVLAQYERGYRTPTVAGLVAIASELNVEASALLDGVSAE